VLGVPCSDRHPGQLGRKSLALDRRGAVAVIAIVGAGIGVGMALGGSRRHPRDHGGGGTGPSRPVPGSTEVAAAAQAPLDPPEQALPVVEPVERDARGAARGDCRA
jgi:hypothetical protein